MGLTRFLFLGKCYLVKGAKPLQKYRFYLAVKNHAITSKLEQKIKDLGGVRMFILNVRNGARWECFFCVVFNYVMNFGGTKQVEMCPGWV